MRFSLLAVLLALLAPEASGASFVSGGIERQYRLHLPAGTAAPPLVVALHGIGDDIDRFAAETGFDTLADRDGFAVLYPEGAGSGHGWNAGFCCGSAVRDGLGDVDFVLTLIGALDGIDRRRVFIVGMSNGGMLAYRIAAEHPERVAGLAAVAAAIGGTGRDGTPRFTIPVPATPVPVMIVHGMRDPYVLYDGGVSPVLHFPGRRNASVGEALALWTRANRCAAEGTAERVAPGLLRTRGSGCAAETVLFSVADGSHEWFGRLGGVPLAEVIWRFFAAQKPR